MSIDENKLPKNLNKAYENLLLDHKEFVSIVSHDLRAPFRQMDAFVKLFLEELGPNLSNDQLTYQKMIEQISKDANKTLDTLVAYSNINVDPEDFKKVDLNKALDEAIKKARTLHNYEHDIVITALPLVSGNYELLVDLFFHLIDNAIKFTLDGCVSLVKVSLIEENNHPIICIEDDGAGIRDEVQKDVFTIFKRFK